jgi:hypothetical protein
MSQRPEIFVFGSNLAGRHGKGAALTAATKHNAKYGVGNGPTGNAYAIPTKDVRIRTLDLFTIEVFIREFLMYATDKPALTFKVTRIGCGLAGYTNEQIASLFRGAPKNCLFDEAWKPYLPDAKFWGPA